MTDAIPETQLEEMNLPEDKVLDKLNAVSTAKRLANMVGAYLIVVVGGDSWRGRCRNCMIRTLASARRYTE